MPTTTAKLSSIATTLPPLVEPEKNDQGGYSRFYDLLAQLAAEYKRERDHLCQENTVLRAQLVASAAGTTEVNTPPTCKSDGRCLRAAAGGDAVVEADSSQARPPADIVELPEEVHANGRLPEATLFQLKGEWTKLPTNVSWVQGLNRNMVKNLSHGLQVSPSEEDQNLARRSRAMLKEDTCLINPSHTAKMFWDMAGLILISYDFITIPLQVFDLQLTGFTMGMGYITLVFWTIDMISGFSTGYFQDGELVMKRRRIVKHYCRTWFMLDVLVVVPDWVMTMLGSTPIAGVGRVLRAMRAVRVLRLLRLAKVQKVMTLMYDYLDSEYSFIVVSLIKLLGFILVLNHVIACLWYWLGKNGRDNGEINWIQHAGTFPVDGGTFAWRYTTSLHWSLTQFTPAGMDVSARNVSERLFSVAVLFFALVAFSSVIGSVTASMSALRNLKGGNMKQFWLLRRYLRQKRIPRDLSARVLKYLEHHSHMRENVVLEKNIPVVGELTEQLRYELACELYSPRIVEHPFFAYLDLEMRVVLYRICHNVLRTVSLAAEDVLFGYQDEAKSMFFIHSGAVEYKQVDETILDPPLRNKAWISEAVLWTHWRHRGQLMATVPSEVVGVQPGSFFEVMRLHPRTWYFAKHYGEQFVAFINSFPHSALTDVIFDTTFFDKAIAESDQHRHVVGVARGRSNCLEAGTPADDVLTPGRKKAWTAQ